MMILLDSNVISEAMKSAPEPAVLAWVDRQLPNSLWTCTVVVAELLSGLDLMPQGKRQSQLRMKAAFMFDRFFANRIFVFDQAAAKAYGTVLKSRRDAGRPIDEMDALIAATSLANGATLATRNIAHFESCGITLLNPWQ
jgi:hypothetical protein